MHKKRNNNKYVNQIIVVMVIILVILVLKLININTTNRIIQLIERNIYYEFTINKDVKTLKDYITKTVDKLTERR